jgi:hypothetical protein
MVKQIAKTAAARMFLTALAIAPAMILPLDKRGGWGLNNWALALLSVWAALYAVGYLYIDKEILGMPSPHYRVVVVLTVLAVVVTVFLIFAG